MTRVRVTRASVMAMTVVKFKEYLTEAMRVPVLIEDEDCAIVEWSEEEWFKHTVAERAELEAEAVNGWAMWQIGSIDGEDEEGNSVPADASGIYEGEEEILGYLNALDEEDKEPFHESRSLTDEEKKKLEAIVLELKKKEQAFRKKYGDDWKAVMYATATKLAKGESYNGLVKGLTIPEDIDVDAIAEKCYLDLFTETDDVPELEEDELDEYKARNTMQRRATQKTKDRMKFRNRAQKLKAKIERKKGGNKVKRIKMRKKWMRKNKSKIKNAQKVFGGKVKSKFTKK